MRQQEQRPNYFADPVPVVCELSSKRMAFQDDNALAQKDAQPVGGERSEHGTDTQHPVRFLVISDWSLFRAGLKIALSHGTSGLQCSEVGSVNSLKQLAHGFRQIDCFLIDREIADFQVLYQYLVCRDYPCIVLSRHYGHGCLISGAVDSNRRVWKIAAHLLRLVGSDQQVFYDRDAYMRQTGANNHALGPSPSSYLSIAQCTVLKLLCAGRTNQEIASALDISVYTVKAHLGKIYRKMGASSRTQVVALAVQHRRLGNF